MYQRKLSIYILALNNMWETEGVETKSGNIYFVNYLRFGSLIYASFECIFSSLLCQTTESCVAELSFAPLPDFILSYHHKSETK